MSRTGPPGGSVLVTGGAGFIGRHVLEGLTPERDVRVLDRFETTDPDALPDGVDTTASDVRDREALIRATDGVGTIVHLARPTAGIEGVRSVLERACEIDAHVVFASSAAVYGDPETIPTPESADREPISTYGDRKLRAERLVESLRDKRGLSATVLRYFNVYGPRVDGGYGGLPGLFLERARREGVVEVTGDGSQTRDFVHVRDVANATIAALEDRPNAAINVGTGSARSVATVARWIAGLTDARVESRPRPESDPDRSRAATGRMERLLGVRPSVTLETDTRNASRAAPAVG